MSFSDLLVVQRPHGTRPWLRTWMEEEDEEVGRRFVRAVITGACWGGSVPGEQVGAPRGCYVTLKGTKR